MPWPTRSSVVSCGFSLIVERLPLLPHPLHLEILRIRLGTPIALVAAEQLNMNHVKTRDDVNLRVKDWRRGRAVVMMHGWPLSSDTFDDLGIAVANQGMRAIAYDRRGFGRSQQPWDGYDYDTLADDLAAVIDQTNAEEVTLLGF